jgi:hypothetical protein
MQSSSRGRQTTNFQMWRVCAWAGPIFVLGFLIFWAIIAKFVPPPPQYWSADQVFGFYMNRNLQIRAGMVGVLFFAPFYFVWSAVLSRIMRFMEGPDGVLSYVEILGGVCTTVITLGLGVMWLGASFRTEARTPQDVQLLHDLGWLYFNSTFMVTFLQLAAFGTSILIDERQVPLFPRWLGWASYATASISLVIVFMPFFNHGPFAWQGLLTFWSDLTAFFVWAIVTMYLTFVVIGKLEKEAEL